MDEQNPSSQTAQSGDAESQNPEPQNQRPATEVIQEVVSSTKQAFEAGLRVIKNLEELQNQAKRATDVRAQIKQHPYALAGAVIFGCLLLSLAAKK